jgi:hypothetical protein
MIKIPKRDDHMATKRTVNYKDRVLYVVVPDHPNSLDFSSFLSQSIYDGMYGDTIEEALKSAADDGQRSSLVVECRVIGKNEVVDKFTKF